MVDICNIFTAGDCEGNMVSQESVDKFKLSSSFSPLQGCNQGKCFLPFYDSKQSDGYKCLRCLMSHVANLLHVILYPIEETYSIL